MRFSKVNALILTTGPGFTVIAFFFGYCSDQVNLTAGFSRKIPWFYQIAGSALITPVIALMMFGLFTRSHMFSEVDELCRSLYLELRPSLPQIAGLSIAAGIGEEMLFRGVFQPVFGVLITSLLFAGLHTGFRFGNRVFLTYSMMVFLISLVLGWIALNIGLPAAITAHGFWDFSVLAKMRFEHRRGDELRPVDSPPR